MAVSENSVRVYEELAEHHGRHNELRQRDLFLVLAADAAQTLGQREHAERIRQRLLAVNPHHLLKPFGSLAQALQSPDIQEFVADLRRQCPPETAEQMLEARRNGLPPPSSAALIPAHADEPELKVYRLQEAAEAAAVSPPPAPAPRGPAPRPAASPAVRPP